VSASASASAHAINNALSASESASHFACLSCFSNLSLSSFRRRRPSGVVAEKVPIPDEFLEMITVFNREAMECLEKSQAQFDAWKRNHTMEQIILFLWRALFIRFLQMIDADYRQRFSLYGTLLWKKDHAINVRKQDICKKKQALHEALKSWTHLVPPLINDIIVPGSHLQNEMLMEQGSENCGIPPVTGFVEPPTFQTDAVRLSISDYILSECAAIADKMDECDNPIVKNFVLNTINPNYFDYDPFKDDPRFLLDLMERYGLTFYLQICRMFPGLISEFHPTK
jgi:hypothetical protein